MRPLQREVTGLGGASQLVGCGVLAGHGKEGLAGHGEMVAVHDRARDEE